MTSERVFPQAASEESLSDEFALKKIVLVNPPYLFWSPEKNYLRPFIGTLPSLGLLSLAAVLRQKKYEVKVIEGTSGYGSLERITEAIVREDAQFVGFSCTTASVDNGARIAEAVKERQPSIRAFVGGPHVTALPVKTLLRYPAFDYGLAGEGEIAFPEMLAALEGGRSPEGIGSAVFREGNGIRLNPRRALMENLDELPFPAYDLLPSFPAGYAPALFNYVNGPTAPIASSRGCPQRCTFCDRSVFGTRYRYFSEDYLLELMSLLRAKFGVRHLVFVDDQFAALRSRLMRFCERLLEKDLKLTWSCDARADTLDGETLAIMKKAGCWMISYGVESGSAEILESLQKGITLAQVEEVVHRTRQAGIRAKGLFMIGSPGETETTLRQTLDFILNCPFDEINLSYLTPFPGTAIYEKIKGSEEFSEEWARMNALNPLLRPQGLAVEDLQKAYGRIIRSFYMRPGISLAYLRILLKSRENRARLAAGLSQWLLSRFRSPA